MSTEISLNSPFQSPTSSLDREPRAATSHAMTCAIRIASGWVDCALIRYCPAESPRHARRAMKKSWIRMSLLSPGQCAPPSRPRLLRAHQFACAVIFRGLGRDADSGCNVFKTGRKFRRRVERTMLEPLTLARMLTPIRRPAPAQPGAIPPGTWRHSTCFIGRQASLRTRSTHTAAAQRVVSSIGASCLPRSASIPRTIAR